MRVQLRNGWYATIADNAKGNTRMATVEGVHTETGSVYSHDIVRAQILKPDYKPGDVTEWVGIEYTPAQMQLWKRVGSIGF